MTVKGSLAALVGLLVVAASVSVSGCAIGCGANDAKLAALRRGMSYDETIQVMGCRGMLVTEFSPRAADYAVVEWSGPDSLFRRTRIEFENGKLLSYTTESRGAL